MTLYVNGTREAVLEIARANLGFVEGPNNDNPFAKVAGHANNQPWCASFVVAVFRKAGAKLPGESAYTPALAQAFKDAGRWHTGGGQPGDVVFFRWPKLGRIAHVGIVEEVRPDGSYVCIEGNTDVRGGRTGGCVMRQVRRANIAGFGRPVYLKALVKKTSIKQTPLPALKPPKTNVPPGRSPALGLENPPLYGPKVADVHRYLVKLDPANTERLGTDLTLSRYGRPTSVLVSRFKKNRDIAEPGWGPACWEWARRHPRP